MQDSNSHSLDPEQWSSLRAEGHRMLDDILDYLEHIRDRPVWQPVPDHVRSCYREPLPSEATDLQVVYQRFVDEILPYTAGNPHPRFMGWVHGGGTPIGVLAEMLAAGLNANVGGRNQMPVEVERQIVHWMRELFDFPETASGLFVTGSSMANLVALLVARTSVLGQSARQVGVHYGGASKMVAYASAGAHDCVRQAMDLAGFGAAALRIVPLDAGFCMDIQALEAKIDEDLAEGFMPFFVTGTAGSVDVGAIDNLKALADIAEHYDLWFHVDGAFGALGQLSTEIAPRLVGIERAHSIAFDFHKWLQVPYDAGFILVRNGTLHEETFSSPAAYLSREAKGLAAGSPWPCDFGPDLSRGFRALKTWFTLQVYGTKRLGQMILSTCQIARYLEQCVKEEPDLELLAPVSLNIVCFRYCVSNADDVNRHIVIALHESGVAVPSTTRIGKQLAIRCAIFNHRTEYRDIDILITEILRLGSEFSKFQENQVNDVPS